MHDEVSETENIRKNLAIERMIVEGCDILLDVNQTFVRQGKAFLFLLPTRNSITRVIFIVRFPMYVITKSHVLLAIS